MSVIDTIAATLHSRRESAIAAYRQLVIDLGNESSKAKPETIEQILRDSGKSIEDLDADARRAKRRSEWRATIAKAPEAKKQIDDARKAIEAADEELEQAKRDRHAKVRPLSAAITEGQDQLNATTTAKAELLNTMWAEDKERLASLNWQVEQKHKALTEAKSRLAAIRSRTEIDRDEYRRQHGWVKDGQEPIKLSASGQQIQDAENRVKQATEALDNAIDERDTFTAEALAR